MLLAAVSCILHSQRTNIKLAWNFGSRGDSIGASVVAAAADGPLLEAIEVSKVLTPDMDGDAIGGTNLVTKIAPDTPRLGLDLRARVQRPDEGN